jgi:Arc/MetJ-type ribon-helix-helix transcriptional regulator
MATHAVTVKLTQMELHALDDLVLLGAVESRSAGLRAGLGCLFDKHKLTADAEREIETERRYHSPRSRRGWYPPVARDTTVFARPKKGAKK